MDVVNDKAAGRQQRRTSKEGVYCWQNIEEGLILDDWLQDERREAGYSDVQDESLRHVNENVSDSLPIDVLQLVQWNRLLL